jgi:thymidylate synthase
MTQYHDCTYLNLLRDVLADGVRKSDRTGTGTTSTFGKHMRFDLSNMSIPLLTTKKMHTKSIIHELLWYLTGDTNIKYLTDNGVRIWQEWADKNGDLGPVYGQMWRMWPSYLSSDDGTPDLQRIVYIDQIADVIHTLNTNPDDRRMIVSAWNVGMLQSMALPPCHMFFQFWSSELPGSDRRQLKCQLYQRSCDSFLGVPFNIVQYSILTHMIAQITNHVATEFIWTGGDVHLYNDHMDQAAEQLTRAPLPSPTLALNPDITHIDEFSFDDINIVGYKHHPTITANVSV